MMAREVTVLARARFPDDGQRLADRRNLEADAVHGVDGPSPLTELHPQSVTSSRGTSPAPPLASGDLTRRRERALGFGLLCPDRHCSDHRARSRHRTGEAHDR